MVVTLKQKMKGVWMESTRKGGRIAAVLAVIFCGTLLGGCTSYKFTTTIHKVPDAELLIPEDTTFRIVRTPHTHNGGQLLCGGSTQVHLLNASADSFDSALPGLLMETAARRYPRVFANGANSVPLIVRLDTKDVAPPVSPLNLVSLFSLMTIPLCVSESTAFDVDVSVFDAGTGSTHIASVAFERRDTVLRSSTPLGWIPVPGHADRRLTPLLDSRTQLDIGAELTLESIVDATVQGLTRKGRAGLAELLDGAAREDVREANQSATQEAHVTPATNAEESPVVPSQANGVALPGPRLGISAHIEDDPAQGSAILGNGDGRITQGEAFDLLVVITNASTSTTEAVTCTVTLPADRSVIAFGELQYDVAALAPAAAATNRINLAMPLGMTITTPPACTIEVKEGGSPVDTRSNYVLPMIPQ